MKLKNIITSVALIISSVTLCAQSQLQIPELTDSNVRSGKLQNGLSYYILHNEFPKGQANFHIAQKVGAVQEEENQNGLAHFLEHMCFNGTKNFPDKSLLTWLESIGVKFGYNLNAHTGTDETVYDITNVPVARESIIDSCLLILHDWANALTLADEEIEKERGVIHEEWRTGNGAISRMLNRHASELYPGTKYATHDVIGSMDIIDNFPPQVLRDYYYKWYRPDLQGIIVVGDIDVDLIENKIKNMFSSIQMPQNPAEFTYQQVADNENPIIISDKDAEMQYNILIIAQKFEILPRQIRNTQASFVNDYMKFVVSNVINERFVDISMGQDPPFAGCQAAFSAFLYANTKGSLMIQAMVNDKGTEVAESAVLTELLRLKRFGITPSEYDRARTEYLSFIEKLYNNRNSDKNASHAQRLINHFIDNEPIADVSAEYEFITKLAPMLPVEAINQYVASLFIPEDKDPSVAVSEYPNLGYNLVIFSLAPDKEGVVCPNVETLTAVLNDVNNTQIEAYVDNVVTEPLLANLPAKGSVVSSTVNDVLGYTILNLSNGAKVILKPTDFKDNEILLHAISFGGASMHSDSEYPSAILANDIISNTGLAQFSLTDLMKLTSGIQANVSLNIDDYSETVSGRTTVKDVETMMQLLYLAFTAPREDRQAFENVKKLYTDQLANVALSPEFVYQDSTSRIMYNYHPRAHVVDADFIGKVDYDTALKIYKERFGNAADFTFTIVGSFTIEQMIPLVEQYVASLPTNGDKEVRKDIGKDFVKGNVRKQFVYPNEGQKAIFSMLWHADKPNTLENRIMASITGQIMSNNLLASVREDEGAAYSPMSRGYLNHDVNDYVIVRTAFSLNPDKYKTSEELTTKALETLAYSIPDSELAKMKEYMLKQIEENVKENSYWMHIIENNEVEGIDSHTQYRDIVKNVTTKDIQKFVKEILEQGNCIEILMLPN